MEINGKFRNCVTIIEAFKIKAKPNEEKKEIIIPLMREGWGNEVDGNYYTLKAIQEAASRLNSGRKKMYFNHTKNENDERDIRDWCASIQEAFIETTEEAGNVLFGRVAIRDSWLWERCKSALDEIATSMMGKGRATKGIVEGKQANIIEGIGYIKSCDFVDYPGNAPMGMAYFVESEAGKSNTEDKDMELKDLTVAVIKENRPDILKSIEDQVVSESSKKQKEYETKIGELETANKKLSSDVESYKIKEQLAEQGKKKDEVIEKCLKESKLPETAKTALFIETLKSCNEKKEGDKVITIEEQVKALITDRETVLGLKGVKEMGKSKEEDGVDTKVQESFNAGIFGVVPEKKAEQK